MHQAALPSLRFALRRASLAGATLLLWNAAWGVPAGAIEFEKGELSGNVDTTVTVGTSVRVTDRDCDLIYRGHGGCNPSAFFVSADDGNLNYDKWDFFSAAVKATTDLELRWRNYGAFFRATAFYDAIANDHDPQRTDLDRDARYRGSPINSGVTGLGFLLLDAYAWGGFDLDGRALEIRAGNQFLSWGESLFTPGGISQSNAVDVTRLRTPGSALKEAFLPAPMLWASFEPFENWGIETYYQFYWNRTELDPTGTYFSFNDLVGRGAQGLFFPRLTAGGTVLEDLPADPGSNPQLSPEEMTTLPCNPVVDPNPLLNGAPCGIPRSKDDKPSDHGQLGVALRYYSQPIRTEFGLYYMRFHSKTPGVGFTAGEEGANVFSGALTSYFREYPEDINLYGFSVSTELFNVAFGAEISYRPDDPVAIRANGIGTFLACGPFPFVRCLGDTGEPAEASGFVTENRLQAQLNWIWTVGPGTRLLGPLVSLLRVDDIQVIGEVAMVKYKLDHQEDFDDLNDRLPEQLAVGYAGPTLDHKVTEFSWGYQLLIQPTYTNPFGIPIRVTPRFGFQHDVNGTTPGLLPFIEERKAITVGVEVDYLNTWGMDLAYTSFFGGGTANLLNDRDFVSLSLSYSF
jgi:hypothetical protein